MKVRELLGFYLESQPLHTFFKLHLWDDKIIFHNAFSWCGNQTPYKLCVRQPQGPR